MATIYGDTVNSEWRPYFQYKQHNSVDKTFIDVYSAGVQFSKYTDGCQFRYQLSEYDNTEMVDCITTSGEPNTKVKFTNGTFLFVKHSKPVYKNIVFKVIDDDGNESIAKLKFTLYSI